MSALVRVVARERRDLLGEGPVWSARENALFWVDILARKVQRLSLAASVCRLVVCETRERLYIYMINDEPGPPPHGSYAHDCTGSGL
jgi:sugar lactone lactonase YvrE